MIAQGPLHRSGHAAFPHPAPTSGNDAKSLEWISVTDTCGRNPSIDVPGHPLPGQVMSLTTSLKRSLPEPTNLESERAQPRGVHRHTVVTEVPTDDAAQPRALLADRV